MQTIGVAPNEFTTDRLNAERLRLDHLEELVEMHRDERIMATLDRRSVRFGSSSARLP